VDERDVEDVVGKLTRECVVDCIYIRGAYSESIKMLKYAGRLLRTTEAGRRMWSARHKTAISGLCVLIKDLMDSVPTYKEEEC